MKNSLLLTAMLVLSLVTGVSGQQLNGAYTINPSGSGASNFISFTAAVSALTTNGVNGPVTFTVAAATYTERVTIPAISGASSTNTITFDGGTGNASSRILQFAFGTTGNNSVLELNGADYIRVRNLTIKGTATNLGWGILMRGIADYNIIENCVIDLSTVTTVTTNCVGIVFSGSTTSISSTGNHANNNIIQNNTITGGPNGGPYYGIYYYGLSSGGNNNNQFLNNTISDYYYMGMYMYYYLTGTVIKGNSFTRPTRASTTTFYGIYMYGYHQNTNIEGNKFFNPQGASPGSTNGFYGIAFYYSYNYTNNRINNNSFYNINNASYRYPIYSYYNYNMNIYNNTVNLDYNSNTISSDYGIYVYSGGGTTTSYAVNIKNNILKLTSPATNTAYYRVGMLIGDDANYGIDNNVMFINGTGTSNFIGYFNGSYVTTWNDWRLLKGGAFDPNGWNIDPLFASSSNPVPTTCVLDNKGQAGLVSTDITGASRGSAPDPGAYEFNTGAGANNAGVSRIVSPNQVCTATQNVTLTLRNYGTVNLTSAQINWTLNNVSQTPYAWTGNLAPGAASTITIGTITPTPNTAYNIKMFASSPNGVADGCSLDDTAYSTLNFVGVPANPVFSSNPYNVCGTGVVPMSTAAEAGATTLWYPSMSSNTLLSNTDSYSPNLSTTTSFAASKARMGVTQAFANVNPYTYYGGGFGNMFDIVANGGSAIIVDSISFIVPSFYATAGDIILYSKPGTFSGFESNSSAWTANTTWSNVTPLGYPAVNNIPTGGIVIPAGSRFGFYLYFASSCPYIIVTGNQVGDNISIPNGCVVNGQFGGNYTTYYTASVRVHYRKICETSRFPVTVNVSPKPWGADVVSGNKFQGTNNGGSFGVPDVVGKNDTLIYKLTPPAGYNNSQYGTDWYVNNFSFSTLNGTAPSGSDTATTTPSGAGDGTIRFSPSVAFEDSTFEIYVQLKNSFNCDSVLKKYIYVAPKPVANFNSTVACDGKAVSFTNTSTIKRGDLAYSWDFGDPMSTDDVSNDKDAQYIYSGPGTYTARLTVTTVYGYSNTVTKTITVNHTPKPAFSFENECLGTTIAFSNQSTVLGSSPSLTYTWDFGDASSTSTSTNPTKNYGQAKSYNVTLTAKSNLDCEASLTREVTVHPIPDADFNSSGTCVGGNTEFSSASSIAGNGNLGHYWNFGDGVFTWSNAPKHVYDVAGTYKVKLYVVSEFGCGDSMTKNIVITNTPVASFTSASLCHGDSVNLSNTSTVLGGGALTSDWDFGDGVLANNNASTVKHYYFAPGTYNVKLTVKSGTNCTQSVTLPVSIVESPSALFTTEGGRCEGTGIKFVDASTSNSALSYNWNFGSAQSTQQNPEYTFATAGPKDVWLKVTSGSTGCVDSVKQTITVNALPNPSFTYTHNTSIEKEKREISVTPALSNLFSYNWDMGDGTSFQQIAPVYRYTSNGPFTIKLTVKDDNGCINTSTKVVAFSVSSRSAAAYDFNMNVFPNPLNNQSKVVFTLAKNASVKLKVLDQLGRVVAELENAKLSAGAHNYTMDGLNLAQGTYYVNLEVDGVQSVMPVVKF